MKRKVGPPSGMSTEESLIANDPHRNGGYGSQWVRERLVAKDEAIEEFNTRPVGSRLDGPTA